MPECCGPEGNETFVEDLKDAKKQAGQ